MTRRERWAAFVVQIPEILLLLAVLASVAWVVAFYRAEHYLPQPFIFNTFDTFMDWFNTAQFAQLSGAFDRWHTVYPPLSFVFLKTLTVSECYISSPTYARDCDWLSRAWIFGFYILDVVLASLAFRRACRERALLRSIAFALGLPMLFLLERGNLILPCLAFFIIAYGELTRSERLRLTCMAVTINFKPYLLLPVLSLAFRREWRALELAGIATISIFLVTLAIFGSGSPFQIVENTGIWVAATSGQVWEQIYFSTSYAPFLEVTRAPIPVLTLIPSRTLEMLLWIIPLVIRTSQAVALLCLAGAWLQPHALSMQRIATLLMTVHLVTQSPGGYTLTFLVFLLFLEPWRRPGPIVAIVAAYLLSISYDWQLSSLHNIPSYSWLADRPVQTQFGLSVGHFLRPALVMTILWALVLDSLALIIRAHRTNRPSLGLAAAAASA